MPIIYKLYNYTYSLNQIECCKKCIKLYFMKYIKEVFHRVREKLAKQETIYLKLQNQKLLEEVKSVF